MKNLLIAIFAIIISSNCSAQSFNSTTFIDAHKSFVLGEGKHPGYSVTVLNDGKVTVEVYSRQGSTSQLMGVLQPGKSDVFPIADNQAAIFKNLGEQQAVIKLKLKQAKNSTSLSMNYSDN